MKERQVLELDVEVASSAVVSARLQNVRDVLRSCGLWIEFLGMYEAVEAS